MDRANAGRVKKALRGVALLSALCVAVAGAYLFNYQRNMVPIASPTSVPGVASDDELASLRSHRVFFGHQSVGDNILQGVRTLYADTDQAPPNFTSIASANDLSSLSDGYVADAHIGHNGDPESKIAAFDQMMRSGVGDHVDVALMKLCYVDFGLKSDPRAVFEKYQNTMGGLERDYPQVKFIYTTAPLESQGELRNWKRTQFNSLVRTELKHKQVLDIAAIESTSSTGDRATGSKMGLEYEALQAAYTTDGGHLNPDGAKRAAQGFVSAISGG